MSSKERISTRPDSRQRRKITFKTQTKFKHFQIFYNNEKILTIEIEAHETVKNLNRFIKNRIKDRFYNYISLQSTCGLEVLDYALQNSEFSLSEIHQGQKLRICLQGQVHDLNSPTLNDFFFMKCLGKGGSSTVYLVRHKQNCKMYALKQVEKTYITDFKKMEFLLREKKILTEIAQKSYFSSKIYATFESKDHINFLLEYCPGGQILLHLQNMKMEEEQIKLYFCQVLLAIESLHKQKIIFRDLKPENILIDLKGNGVLSDFGLCKTNVSKEELTLSYCGSDIYMPPEIKNQVGYNYHADFYTLGAFLCEMITGLPPYYDNRALEFPEKTSFEAIQLCLKLLDSDLKKRICDFQIIRESKWLKNIDWEKLKIKQYRMPIKLNLYRTYIHEDFRQPLTFDEINEPIFDRLFDFFFYMSNDQGGISNCYIRKSQIINNPRSKIDKGHQKGNQDKIKIKEKSKNHKKSTQKFNKLLGKDLELEKLKEKSKNKSEKRFNNHQDSKERKSKSYKKKSTENSPYLHNLEKERKKQKNFGQKQAKQELKMPANIYQKSGTSPLKIEMKHAKSGNLTLRSSFRSPQLTVIQSPLSKRKNL